jgi:superfamily II DNA or RNA helicase
MEFILSSPTTHPGLLLLILMERKTHLEVLNLFLKKEFDTLLFTGDLSQKQRTEKITQIESGSFQILLATGQLIGEGTDFPDLDCLFLTFPFAFSGKLTQYIGRLQRGKLTQRAVYDYRDLEVGFLEKLFRKRLGDYKRHWLV